MKHINTTMKRLYTLKNKVLFLLLLALTGIAKAQTHEFAPVGAEWYYERYYREGWNLTGITYDRFRSLRTVEINGWECKEIELFQNLDCDGLVNPHTEYRYIYQEGDQVYEVENGQRYLMYDLSKGPGEYWVAQQYGDTVYVVSVDYIELNDGNRRRIWKTSPENSFCLYINNIIEGIGMDRSVFPFYDLDGPPPCMHGEIRCYSEDGIPLIVSEAVECDYEILAINEHDEPSIASMNTLVNDVLRIDFSEMQQGVKRVRITDLTGKAVGTYETVEMTIDINFLDKPAGMYLVQIIMGAKVVNNKIVKR